MPQLSPVQAGWISQDEPPPLNPRVSFRQEAHSYCGFHGTAKGVSKDQISAPMGNSSMLLLYTRGMTKDPFFTLKAGIDLDD
jgi:hypothetical protein